jgi:hypothetical protein
MTPEEEQLDRLTTPQLIAFLHNAPEVGPDHLRQMLVDAVRKKPLQREYIEAWADELEALGLFKPAKLIEDFAKTQPSMADLVFCDYERGSTNEKAWLATERQKAEIHRRQHEKCKLKLRGKKD